MSIHWVCRRQFVWVIALLFAAIAASSTGCALSRRPIIPELDTAEDQFIFALDRRTQLKRRLVKPDDVKKETRDVIAAYEKVVERFPDDTRHTPMARLAIGSLNLNINEAKPALKQFELVQQNYPDDAELQAVALTGMAESLMLLARYEEARLTLLKCIETYENEESESIKSNVVRCRRHLARIQYM